MFSGLMENYLSFCVLFKFDPLFLALIPLATFNFDFVEFVIKRLADLKANVARLGGKVSNRPDLSVHVYVFQALVVWLSFWLFRMLVVILPQVLAGYLNEGQPSALGGAIHSAIAIIAMRVISLLFLYDVELFPHITLSGANNTPDKEALFRWVSHIFGIVALFLLFSASLGADRVYSRRLQELLREKIVHEENRLLFFFDSCSVGDEIILFDSDDSNNYDTATMERFFFWPEKSRSLYQGGLIIPRGPFAKDFLDLSLVPASKEGRNRNIRALSYVSFDKEKGDYPLITLFRIDRSVVLENYKLLPEIEIVERSTWDFNSTVVSASK
ncbi:MAG TPA: hypothetical protein PKA63_02475 [Oligoflexia bacterium]|nr:hypothetical protein [Oligoflexia bacterium]HMP47517.1 hypothetical protein [Oligoflexia bacterium]